LTKLQIIMKLEWRRIFPTLLGSRFAGLVLSEVVSTVHNSRFYS